MPALAQQRTVTGHVLSSTGGPLVSATVQVKGTNVGRNTDANGAFSIPVTGRATLVISYVGYAAQEIAVSPDQTTVDVTLQPSASSQLNEVVVIGYGTASKRDLTGSIVKIQGKEVADKPNSNPVSSLQGKVAGLSVVNNGTPGQDPDIRIRGTVSIGQVHPLYVVDGILEDNINFLNPNDIESIEVLKDPSSLAIFGVRGATGAIVITTKRAAPGKVTVSFNASYGFKKLVDKIKMANADQFKTLFAEERFNNGVTDPYDYGPFNANTDWISAVTRSAQFTNNNISISGATDRNRFNLGLGYLYDEGVVKHIQLDRITATLNDEFRVSKAIRIGVNVNASRQHNPYNGFDVLDAARKVIPLVSSGTQPFLVKNPYGGDSVTENLYSLLDVSLQNSGVINPLLQLENEWSKTISYEYREVGSIFAEVTFLRNFTFRSTFYGDMSDVNTRSYTPLYYGYDPRTNKPQLNTQTTRVQESDNTYRKAQQDHILTYKQSFGPHNFTGTAGFTTYYFGNFNRTGIASQPDTTRPPIPNDPRFWYVTSGFENSGGTSANSSQSEYTTVSFLARILYNYQNRYFLNGSFRDDASSRLPEQNRHQQFWAIGAAWDLSRESFMENQKIFNYLKVKGSIGVLGNQTATDLSGNAINYPFYPNLQTGTNAVFGNNIYSAAVKSYIPNPNLKWETVNAKEIGVELAAFNNRLHFEANYYNKLTKNLMTYVSRTPIGLPDELINGGDLKNWGEEFSANWVQNFSKDLTLNVSGNITFLNNKVISLAADLPTGVLSRNFENNGAAESRTMPGFPIGSFFGYVVEGIYQSYNDILKSPPASALGAYRPGDFKFKDINGDGKIDANDRTIIGNPTPKFMYGGSVNLTYKQLTLGVDVQGVYGNEIFRTWASLESPFQRVNYAELQVGAWHGPGTSNWVPLLSQQDRFNYVGSTYNIEDGSYFRIRNVQLGYNFSSKLLSGWHAQILRVYANVQNLKTFKHNSGYTAEYGGDATAFGYDFAGGAIPMTVTFGINLTF